MVRLAEASPPAKQVRLLQWLSLIAGVRFANNIYGGMQFVDKTEWGTVIA
jgi:hypothetical protein